MVKAVQKFSGLIYVAFVVIIFLTCCRKTETLIGKKLIPGSDYVNGIYTDTLTLKAKTIREDSLYTESNTQFVLGAMTDGVFGHSYAGIYSQVLLNSAAVSFGDTAVIDSMVLSLNLAGYYGDTNAVHSFRVFRLTDSITSTVTSYGSRKTFAFNSTPIGTKSNVKIGKSTLATSFTDIDALVLGPTIRIHLDTSLGQQMLNQSPTGAFTDNSTFLQYFKGIYVDEDTLSGTRNSMAYINMQSSFIGLYYHTPHIAVNPPLRLYANGGAVSTNYFNHNYKSKIVQAALLNATKSVDTTLYVQSMAGVKTWVTIPYLSNLYKTGTILINKAEVVVTVAPSNMPDTTVFPPPAQMELVVADSLFENSEVIDETFPAGYPLYGGTKSYYTDPSGHKYIQYTFSVAGELQKLVSNLYTNNYNGFYIITNPSYQVADRIILGGVNRKGDPYQMKLNLVYTKIP